MSCLLDRVIKPFRIEIVVSFIFIVSVKIQLYPIDAKDINFLNLYLACIPTHRKGRNMETGMIGTTYYVFVTVTK